MARGSHPSICPRAGSVFMHGFLAPRPVTCRKGIATADEEFVDSHLVGQLLKRLFGITNRERDEDSARPR